MKSKSSRVLALSVFVTLKQMVEDKSAHRANSFDSVELVF